MSPDSNAVCIMVNHALNSAKAKSIICRNNVVLCCLRYGRKFQQVFACKHKSDFIDSQLHSQLKDNDYLFLKSAMEVLIIGDDALTSDKTETVMESYGLEGMFTHIVSSDGRVYIYFLFILCALVRYP